MKSTGRGSGPERRRARSRAVFGVVLVSVAGGVGYGSVDAMARAFRDVGLASPSVVQDGLRAASVADSAHGGL